jgi:hypothetical protein
MSEELKRLLQVLRDSNGNYELQKCCADILAESGYIVNTPEAKLKWIKRIVEYD